jgi:transcriptional regulator with XRE-family HTH domain
MNTLLGACIEQKRKEKGLTQEKMAECISCSRQKYARMEKGEADITYKDLVQISDILGTSVSDITATVDLDQQDGFTALFRQTEDGDVKDSLETVKEILDFFYALKREFDRVKGV